jgi:hypothetical protein
VGRERKRMANFRDNLDVLLKLCVFMSKYRLFACRRKHSIEKLGESSTVLFTSRTLQNVNLILSKTGLI